jgi:hypothetical protein
MEKFIAFLLMSFVLGTTAPKNNETLTFEVGVPIPKREVKVEIIVPNTTQDFMSAIAFKESRNIFDTVNKYGMLGKYQFSRATLNGLGYDNISDTVFLSSEALQDEAMIELLKHNHKILRKQIKKYDGLMVDSLCVTESGILAAAHLAGPSNVKKWLRTNGKKTRTDGFGTSIETYMNKFANYKIEL